ncbi:MAG: hypothetical protein AAGG44_19530 [Planctomycetota bacterium]
MTLFMTPVQHRDHRMLPGSRFEFGKRCVVSASGAVLLSMLVGLAAGCRSTLLNRQLRADLIAEVDPSTEAELADSSPRLESRAGSSVRPHPLTQRLRPGGAAPAPTERKKLADRRRLQRPEPEPDNDPAVDRRERQLLTDYAESKSDTAGSPEIDQQRARIQDEIRRRKSRNDSSDVAASTSRLERADKDAGQVAEFSDASTPAGNAMVFSLTDAEKPMGIRRIDSESFPKVPAVSGRAKKSTGSGARIRFTDSDVDEVRTASVEELLGPVSEASEDGSVAYAEHAAPVETAKNDLPPQSAGVAESSHESPRTAPQEDEPSQNLGPGELIDGLFTQLDQEYAAATSPQARINIEKKKRLLSMVADDIKAATSPIDGLQPAAQEYIQQTLTALYDATDDAGHPSMTRRLTRALESHRQAASNLARVASLRVVSPAFCTEVDSFGVIKKFESYSFQQDQEVLLYCELENFASKQVAGGFETRLQGSYEIVDAQGKTVLEQVLPKDSDICANQRRDFYIAYRLFMPVRIEPGAYQLKLYIEDIHGKKFGQADVDFRIVGAK